MSMKDYLPDLLVNSDKNQYDEYAYYNTDESESIKYNESVEDSDIIEYKLAGKEIEKVGEETSREIRSELRDQGVPLREYSPSFLRSASDLPIANSMKRKIASDLSCQEWSLELREEAEEDEEEKEKLKEIIENLHEEYSFEDLRERWAMERVTSGEAVMILRREKNTNEPRKLIIPGSGTMFKKVQDGEVKSYVQKTSTNGNAVEIDKENVIWSHYYAPDSTSYYGKSPLHDSLDTLKKLEELYKRNLKNLKEGIQNGAISIEDVEDSPISEQEFKQLRNRLMTNQGKRTLTEVIPTSVDFTKFQDEWSDLDWMNRKKDCAKELAANFGVPLSYLGFEGEQLNRATDESQRSSYEKSAEAKNLRDFESVMNEIISEISERYKFKFENTYREEQQKKERMQKLEKMAETKIKLDEAGIETKLNDENELVVEGMKNQDSDSDNKTDIQINYEKADSFQEQNKYETRKEEIEDRMSEYAETLEDIIDFLIEQHDGNVTKMKEEIERNIVGSISRKTLYEYLDEYDLKQKAKKKRQEKD